VRISVKKSICELFDQPTGGKINSQIGECKGVHVTRRKICMCELDWNFATCEIEDCDFYCGTSQT
jgi:hypothetical protein